MNNLELIQSNNLFTTYSIGTLVGISVEMIKSIAIYYNKRPRVETITIDIEKLVSDLNLTNEEIQGLNTFFNRDDVQRHFSTFIDHRIIKSQVSNTFELVDSNEFIELTKNMIVDYFANNNLNISNEKNIINYLQGIVSILEIKIINKISSDHFYLYDAVSKIERHLKDIANYKSLTKAINQYENDIIPNKYVNLLKRNHKDNFVYGVGITELDQFYVFPDLIINGQLSKSKTSKLDSWKNIFNESNIISIIGGPGYGKTTFLKSIILNYSQLNVFAAEKMIPIYCDLKTYFARGKENSSYSIENFIYESMLRETGINKNELSFKALQNNILKGNCLIVFDALDEVELEERDCLQKKIINFFEEINSYNKIIITSRSKGFLPRTDVTIEIKSLDVERVRIYLEKMTLLHDTPILRKEIKPFLQQAQPLIKNKFLTSFLVLSLLVNVYRSEQELPTTKNELYNKCFQYIVRQRERSGNKSKFQMDKFQHILDQDYTFEELAYLGKYTNLNISSDIIVNHLMQLYSRFYGSDAISYNATTEFLKFCEQRTEFYVVGTEENTFKFFHRSFFDYYFSKYIVRKYPTMSDLFFELSIMSYDSEVFELVCDLLRSKNYPKYLEFFDLLFSCDFQKNLNQATHEQKKYFNTITLLAAQATEKDILNNYYEYLISFDLKLIEKFNTTEAIISIINKINKREEFFKYLAKKYPLEFWCGEIMLLLWLYGNENEVKIFELMGYQLFNVFFDFAFNINNDQLHFESIPSIDEVIEFIKMGALTTYNNEYLYIMKVIHEEVARSIKNMKIDNYKLKSIISKKIKF